MAPDDFLKIMKYLLALGVLPFAGSLLGAVLTNYALPLRMKRNDWRWQKEQWARELFFETVSRINFIAEHYLKSEHEDKFSMARLGLHETDKEIMRLVNELHLEGHKLKLYLDTRNARIFEQYLCDSQKEYDSAKENWGQWYNEDEHAPIQHTENTIGSQGKAAAMALAKLKLSS